MIATTDAETGAIFGAMLMVIASVVGLWLTVVWIVFPFMVDRHFKALLKQAEQTNVLLTNLLAATQGKAPKVAPVRGAADTAAATAGKAAHSDAEEVYKI